MRPDWVEFTTEDKQKIAVRHHYINIYKEYDGGTVLYIEDGDESLAQVVDESYDQVKEKITKIENEGWDSIVVERFTRDEYESLRMLAQTQLKNLEADNATGDKYKSFKELEDKLNGILKEYK